MTTQQVATQLNLQQNLQPVIASDSSAIQKKNKNKEVIKYASIGVAIIAAITAFVKRKKITEFFTKLFKGADPADAKPLKPDGTGTTTVKPPNLPIDKIEFPEPKFTCGPENADKYTQEKRAYLDSIMKYAKHTDKDLNLKAIEAVDKYGSWEDLEKLVGNYLGTEDENLIKGYVTTVKNIGRVKEDAFYVTDSITPSEHNFSKETYLCIVDATNKLGIGLLDYEHVVDLFKKVSTDPKDELARELIKSLSKWPNKDSVRRLEVYKNHENPVVRESIATIINNIRNNKQF